MVVGKQKKLHDGESFANRWSHPKLGTPFSQGVELFVQGGRGNGEMLVEGLTRIGNLDYNNVDDRP